MITAVIVVTAAAEFLVLPSADDRLQLTVLFVSTIGLALVGVTDDVRPLGTIPRLVLQTAAVAAVLAMLPPDVHIVPALPLWLDRVLALIGGVWLINLVNFMDGIDWMTVAEVVPVTAALAVFGLMGGLRPDATLVAVVLCGAMVGFAPLNRPVAKVFLGDVGSLPLGLLLGWLLAVLADKGHLIAAILLPLYYLADATITLLRRLMNGERITQAHRSHFYQRALDGGLSVLHIVGCVFALNLILAGLAAITFFNPSATAQMTMLALGIVIVAAVLWRFNHAGSRAK